MIDVLRQLEPELQEMDRCTKVISARIRQLNPQTPEAQTAFNQLNQLLSLRLMDGFMIRLSLVLIQGEQNDQS